MSESTTPATENLLQEAGEVVQTPAGRVDRYGIALVLIALTVGFNILAPSGPYIGLVAVGLGAATLIFCLTASDVGPRWVGVVRVVAIVALVIVAITTILGDTHTAQACVALVGGTLALVAPIAIARRLIRQPAVSRHTIAGALCLYLLAGLFFAYVYLAIDSLAGPMFAQTGASEPSQATYFSFVTLATIGYGDLSPAGPIGRLFSVMEGVGAQVYLVTVVAVLVANIGRTPDALSGHRSRARSITPSG